MPEEIVIYIHGVSNDLRGRDHSRAYDALHGGVCGHNPGWPSDYCGVEWGWNADCGPSESHQALTDAQRLLGSRALPVVLGQRDWTFNPARMGVDKFRPLMLYGFGDMFYYVSEDGKLAVRRAVAEQILDYLEPHLGGGAGEVSLTFVGHSAGSVVAFDFLFYLFFGEADRQSNYLGPSRAQAVRQTKKRLSALRKMAQEGNLRVRRLFTIGSPVLALACRSDAIVEILAKDGQLDPADYGLTTNPFNDALGGPRWINYWDRDDPIAWPVEPLMQGDDTVVRDDYVDLSDLVTHVHGTYWESEKIHRRIGEAW